MDRSPDSIHFIKEWAEKKNISQAEVSRAVGANKSVTSRWFTGMVPKTEYLEKIAALFGTDVHGLFRHPDEEWIAKLIRSKTGKDREQIIKALKELFPEE